jgi:hypothetical protein
MGERKPDEVLFPIIGRAFHLPHSALDLELEIRRAGPISTETEFKRIIQMLEPETIRTPLVCSIQKRTLAGGFGHDRPFGRGIESCIDANGRWA